VPGLAAAWALSRVIARLLYDVAPGDTVTFASVPLLLLTVAVIATIVPAWRASRVDPAVALRI
jgi:ABC-type lipoprotein release transport system permease subunit